MMVPLQWRHQMEQWKKGFRPWMVVLVMAHTKCGTMCERFPPVCPCVRLFCVASEFQSRGCDQEPNAMLGWNACPDTTSEAHLFAPGFRPTHEIHVEVVQWTMMSCAGGVLVSDIMVKDLERISWHITVTRPSSTFEGTFIHV